MIIDGFTIAGLVVATALAGFLYVLRWCGQHHACN